MIAIIDYGVGNLRSVEKAFHFIGYEAAVSSDKEFILNADAVVLPGVGAFADAMDRLKAMEMDKLIYRLVEEEKPLFGICLGLQLLFDCSEEGKSPKGLGILKGSVKLIPDKLRLKVPHIGWNRLDIKRDDVLLKDLPQNPYVYFVHSYYLLAEEQEDVAATSYYGMDIDVAVSKGNIFATQFHPEKSGDTGLKILDNFAKYASKVTK